MVHVDWKQLVDRTLWISCELPNQLFFYCQNFVQYSYTANDSCALNLLLQNSSITQLYLYNQKIILLMTVNDAYVKGERRVKR